MTELPGALRRLSKRLFSDAVEQEQFLASFQNTRPDRSMLILPPECSRRDPVDDSDGTRASFQPPWVISADSALAESLEPEIREAAYQLDLSSVFDASPLFFLRPSEKISRILDLCSSPGGKALLSARTFSPELLGCNEVTQKRIPALISNLKRCARCPVEVYSRDPGFFSKVAENGFDLVLVDAPCSGQSLFGSTEAPSGVFHETIVKKSALRQRHILSEAKKTIRAGGYLLYMTCTFSIEENEGVVEWFLKQNPDFHTCQVPELEAFQSRLSAQSLYRLFPHQGYGRGGSSVLFQRAGVGAQTADVLLHPIWKNQRVS